MAAGNQILQAARLTRIIQNIQDPRELPSKLIWKARTPMIPATDGEITARYTGRIIMADLIADDQKAAVYSPGKFTFETVGVPNLKVGQHWTQEQINQYQSMGDIVTGLPDNQASLWSIPRTLDNLRLGVNQRIEALCVAVRLDSYNNDKLGIKLSTTWGTPSDLKVTLTSTATWDNPTTATPVTDILTLKRLAMVRYDRNLNRLSMSTAAFDYMTATTDFINRAKALYAGFTIANASLPTQSIPDMLEIASKVIRGVTIELYDSRGWTQDAAGNITSAPFLSVNKVLFTDSAEDNNPAVIDFANSIVTESIVADMMGQSAMIGNLGGPQRGPVAYITGNPDLNPPNLTTWGVARGFPRKFELQSSAVLTVGTFTDPIAVGEPF